MSPGRSLIVSAAGPAVGLFLGSLALVLMDALPIPDPSLARYAFGALIFVNLGWGLLNLLPVIPLDGGNIVASVMELLAPSRGRLLACYVSFAVVGLLFAAAVTAKQYPATILLLLLAFSTYQTFRFERHRPARPPRRESPRDLVQEAFDALERGDGPALIRSASELVTRADSPEALDEAFHLLAWGRLMNGEPGEAYQALRSMSGERTADPALEGAVLLELGKPAEAMPLLEAARERGGAFAEAYYRRALQEKTT
jgi:hypothetical protein